MFIEEVLEVPKEVIGDPKEVLEVQEICWSLMLLSSLSSFLKVVYGILGVAQEFQVSF